MTKRFKMVEIRKAN